MGAGLDDVPLLHDHDLVCVADGEGREWWNSRKLARLMGYQKYWNFERFPHIFAMK